MKTGKRTKSNKKYKLVQGVGKNDADYVIERKENIDGKSKTTWVCPYYKTWTHMLERAYSEKYHAKFPSYIGTKVCAEWLLFSNFRAWMETQVWADENGKKLHLDKDLLSGTNRGKLYSPETCMFVPLAINMFLAYECSNNVGLPVGVSWHKAKKVYQAKVSNPFIGKEETIGLFNEVEPAAAAYAKRKKELATQYAEIVTDPRLRQVFLDFKV